MVEMMFVIIFIFILVSVNSNRRHKREKEVALRVGLKTRIQINFIEGFIFPKAINNKISKVYPHLSQEEIDFALESLKSFFIISHRAGLKPVAMPSQVVDLAWHEFIIFTKDYEYFCNRAFGQFLHHTPTEAMKSATTAKNGIKLAWRLACDNESIDHKSPERLPMIFAIDRKLKIKDGFIYSIDFNHSVFDNSSKLKRIIKVKSSAGISRSSSTNTMAGISVIDISDSSSSDSSSGSGCGSTCGSSCGGGGD